MANTNQSKLNAFIIEDSIEHANILYRDLCNQPEFGEIKIFNSCKDAALPLLENQPNVIFLDVEMPGCSGFDFFDAIRNRVSFPVKVVIYSAHNQYILDALRHAAFDFLLKPYKQSELRNIIERLTEESTIENTNIVQGGQALQRKLAIQTISNLLLLTIEEVLYLQYSREQRSWLITLTDRSTHRLHQNTNSEDILALHPSLARVSQGNIVNITYLTAIENNTQRCRFCPPFDDIEIYASRRNFAKLKEKFELI